MNLTLEVADDGRIMMVTFYTIDALGKADDGNSIIFLGGKEYYSATPYEQMWAKLKKLKYESSI
jgi:hypothetical protein